MCDTDGVLFIKPCTQSEIDFYTSLQSDEHTRMAEIVPFFMGSLALNDPNDPSDVSAINGQVQLVAGELNPEVKKEVMEFLGEHKQKEPVPEPAPPPPAVVDNVTWIPNAQRKIPTNTAVCLENASLGFRKPNIMDVKLGRRLWADDAPLEKKRRFDKISAETTHYELGFRIAGMRVYKGGPADGSAADLDEEDYKIYDKDYGRNDVNKANVVDAFRSFIYNAGAGIEDEYARAVAEAFRRDLEHVREVLETEETRMYSSSLLFIFEGDGDALKAAIDEQSASAVNSEKVPEKEPEKGPAFNKRIDSGIGMEDEDEFVNTSDGDDDDDGEFLNRSDGEFINKSNGDDDNSDDDDGDETDDEPKIWNLKLIDFAHAKWTPGEGPDENILLGVRSLIEIFKELSK